MGVEEEEMGSSEAERRRFLRSRQQRGRTGGSRSLSPPGEEIGKSRGSEPKIGSAFQAEVPLKVVEEGKRNAEMTRCESQLVYSLELCGGDIDKVDKFMKKVTATLMLRDGFGCSPNGEEAALRRFCMHKGDEQLALQETCKEVSSAHKFPGVGKAWTYEEKCLFVRAMAERAKDFRYIAHEVLNRKTCEVVNMYYTYQKQQNLQHGMRANGYIFDTGDELTEFLPRLGPERISLSLRCLAMTAGDGFPADRRMAQAIRTARDNSTFDDRRKRARSTRSGRQYSSNKE